MTDRIRLAGIEVYAHHGVLEREKEEGQLFSVDLELELDLSSASASDDITDTVDYGDLAEQVAGLVAGQRWNLIETLAERVADLVLDDPRIDAATVTIHKPQAPISVPFRDVSVTVRRSR
ncbi:MAG TPA: dihydroneopterin aldolase [Acidimicrobiia bacterium]|nr:dihydroneopterin aldolase [Acidimicrobiia bacterium]